MRQLCAALLLLLNLASAAQAQGLGAQTIICNKIQTSAVLSAGTFQIVVGNAGSLVHTCGYVFEGLAAGTVQLVYGTGASCTSSTPITSNYATTATTLIVNHISNAFTSSLLGQSLCVIVTGTTSVMVDVYYAQP